MTTKTYNLTPMKQLIDLNGDVTNFDLTFTATTKDGSPFDILVVDQTTLDSNPVLDYKKAVGTMSGNIVADKGVYQNYFLILRADNPCECDITIDIKEIPKREIQNFQHPLQNIDQINKPKSRINWFIVSITLIICILLFYYFYGNKKKINNDVILDQLYNTTPSIETNDINLSSNFKDNVTSNKIQQSLLNKLNNLKI